MIILFTILGILILSAGIFTYTKFGRNLWHKDREWVYYLLNIAGAVILVVSFIAAMCMGSEFSQRIIIDEKIALYENENRAIEENVNAIVSQYQSYESDMFKNFKPDSMVFAIGMYPELKSNELVSKQIELYVENNKTIKELKQKQLDYKVTAWWLYFGR